MAKVSSIKVLSILFQYIAQECIVYELQAQTYQSHREPIYVGNYFMNKHLPAEVHSFTEKLFHFSIWNTGIYGHL